ncbi:MAG: hypothetical protein IAG13_05200 [Deltaproteobacteria bacterium]|nr:hypothetical protein [Nannocystaceae bacterium]
MVRTMAALSLCTACGAKSVGNLDTGDDGSGSSSDGSNSSPSSSVSTEPGSESGSDDLPGTETDPDPSDGSSESGGACPPVESICEPSPVIQDEDVYWSIDGNPEAAEISLDAVPCTVADFQDDGSDMTIELQCDEEELAAHVLVVPHNSITPFNLAVGTAVELTYVAETLTTVEQVSTDYFVALHRPSDGSLILGASSGRRLEPAPGLYSPLGVEVRDDVCPPECATPGECITLTRHAVAVGLDVDAQEITVYDGNSAIIGLTTQFTVVVGTAIGTEISGECSNSGVSASYRLIIYDSSEG